MGKVAALLTENEPPPMKEGQTWYERQVELQNRKRVFDIELSAVKVKKEEEQRERWLQHRREAVAMQVQLVGVNLDKLSVEEAKEKLAEFKKAHRQQMQCLEADLRKRKVEEAVEAAKAKKARKKGAKEAENGTEGSPAAGDGLGGFSNRQCALPRISCEARGQGLGGARMAQRSGRDASVRCSISDAPQVLAASFTRSAQQCTLPIPRCIVDFVGEFVRCGRCGRCCPCRRSFFCSGRRGGFGLWCC
jgi:hypothetical protein